MKMAKLRFWIVLAAVLAVAAVGLAACGGDDDGGSKTSGGGGIASSGGTGSDENYVADLCKASKDLQAAITKMTADPSKLTDQDAAMKAFIGPFEDFSKSLAKAKPPKDLKDYHEQMVKTLNDTVAKMKKGDATALQSLSGTDLPDPPASVKDRLDKLAAKNKDCTDSGLFGS